jgi:hypothetical protein
MVFSPMSVGAGAQSFSRSETQSSDSTFGVRRAAQWVKRPALLLQAQSNPGRFAYYTPSQRMQMLIDTTKTRKLSAAF